MATTSAVDDTSSNPPVTAEDVDVSKESNGEGTISNPVVVDRSCCSATVGAPGPNGPTAAEAANEPAKEVAAEVAEETKQPSLEDFDEDDVPPLPWPWTIFWILVVLASLYGFLFGLGLMGNSFKVLGGKSAGSLFKSIDDPIAGLMVGILATVLVQSSSTSTSVVVGMVGADIISVQTAIPIIMGANIGTSVTNTIVSIGQIANPYQYRRAFSGATVHDCFNLLCVLVFLPLEVATHFLYYWTKLITKGLEGEEGGKFKSPIKVIVSPLVDCFIKVDKKKVNKIAEGKLSADNAGSLMKSCVPKDSGVCLKDLGDDGGGGLGLALSLIVLCICLYGVIQGLQPLVMGRARKKIREVLKFTDEWWGGLLAMAVGVGATIAVQSSSITTSTLTPLVGVGVITLEQMLPLTLGANIGTTCTGLLAAMVSAKRNALQIALCHLFFNIFGILVWYPVPKVRELPLAMSRSLGTLAWLWKWFPVVYIVVVFVIIPMIFIGISAMFQAGPAGIAFGVIVVIIIAAALAYAIYWYKKKGGEEMFMEYMANVEKDQLTEEEYNKINEIGKNKLDILIGGKEKEVVQAEPMNVEADKK